MADDKLLVTTVLGWNGGRSVLGWNGDMMNRTPTGTVGKIACGWQNCLGFSDSRKNPKELPGMAYQMSASKRGGFMGGNDLNLAGLPVSRRAKEEGIDQPKRDSLARSAIGLDAG